MEANEIEKLFDLKIELINEQISGELDKVHSEFKFIRLQLGEIDSRIGRQNAIWKWLLGVLTAIMVSVLTALVIAQILQ